MGFVKITDTDQNAEFILENSGRFKLEYEGIKFESISGTGTLSIKYEKKASKIKMFFYDKKSPFIINNLEIYPEKEFKF